MAYIGTPKASQTFVDSVAHTGKIIPTLTEQDKQRTIVVQQTADGVVPRLTMSIDGVNIYKIPALGHGWGIALGVRQLPRIIEGLIPGRSDSLDL